MTDVNDNPPRFEVPDYQAYGVPEDVPIGTSILQGKEVFMNILMCITAVKGNKHYSFKYNCMYFINL